METLHAVERRMLLREFEAGTLNPSVDPFYHILLTWDVYVDVRDDRKVTTQEEDQSIIRSLRIYREAVLSPRREQLQDEVAGGGSELMQEMLQQVSEAHREDPDSYSIKELPLEFSDERTYWHHMIPLFLVEVKMNIQQAKKMEMSGAQCHQTLGVKSKGQSNVVTVARSPGSETHFGVGDLVMIYLDDDGQTCESGQSTESPDPQFVHPYNCLGVVEAASVEGFEVRIFFGASNQDDNVPRTPNGRLPSGEIVGLGSADRTEGHVEKDNRYMFPPRREVLEVMASHLRACLPVHFTRVMGMATHTREFQALMSIECMPLRQSFLLEPPSRRIVKLRKQMAEGIMGKRAGKKRGRIQMNRRRQVERFVIPETLQQKMNTIHNSSQLDALQSCLKTHGITLIQGPPGTGKTTTIVSLLSMILQSRLPQEAAAAAIAAHPAPAASSDPIARDAAFAKRRCWATDPEFRPWYDVVEQTVDIHENAQAYKYAQVVNRSQLSDMNVDMDVRPRRILVCAPSNAAVDEILRRVIREPQKGGGLLDERAERYTPTVLRVGPNIHETLMRYSLEARITTRIQQRKDQGAERDQVRDELLTDATIVFATLSMCGSKDLVTFSEGFDTVIMDEAGQAVELSTLIPMRLNCDRFIMVGDPRQLSATVFSKLATEKKYAMSLFERLEIATLGENKSMLSYQYRMHPNISQFPRTKFYKKQDGESLRDAENIIEICKPPIPEWYVQQGFGKRNTKQGLGYLFEPLKFIDVRSNEVQRDTSICNDGEALAVITWLRILLMALAEIRDREQAEGMQPESERSRTLMTADSLREICDRVAVISPYLMQVKVIRKQITAMLGTSVTGTCPIDVNTVDGFQGREKDFILFSCVRSKVPDPDKMDATEEQRLGIGFLEDERRMNVALTRARLNLFVFGNKEHLAKASKDLWKSLIKHCDAQCCAMSWQPQGDDKPLQGIENRWKRRRKDGKVGDEEAFWHNTLPRTYHEIRELTTSNFECTIC